MFKIKILISICIFSILLGFTSIIKTQTRIIEKKIHKSNVIVAKIEKDLHEIQLDYYYLSSPGYLSKKIDELSYTQYSPIDFSRIFLSYGDFIDNRSNLTKLKIKHETKK